MKIISWSLVNWSFLFDLFGKHCLFQFIFKSTFPILPVILLVLFILQTQFVFVQINGSYLVLQVHISRSIHSKNRIQHVFTIKSRTFGLKIKYKDQTFLLFTTLWFFLIKSCLFRSTVLYGMTF